MPLSSVIKVEMCGKKFLVDLCQIQILFLKIYHISVSMNLHCSLSYTLFETFEEFVSRRFVSQLRPTHVIETSQFF